MNLSNLYYMQASEGRDVGYIWRALTRFACETWETKICFVIFTSMSPVQLLKQDLLVTRSIRNKRLNEAEAKLQDCFASPNWNIFRDLSNNIEEFITSVTGFINKFIDNIIPTVIVRAYLNQKPWITGNIRTKLKTRAAAFKEWDTNSDAYKKSR